MAGSCRGGKGEGMGILYSCVAKDCGYLFASSQWVQGGLVEEILAMPLLGCWQGWHNDHGVVVPP